MEILQIKELQTLKSESNSTDMITLYVPADCKLWLIKQHVQTELKTAQNIKSKQTRSNVTTALVKMNKYLQTLETIPNNGLVVCCANHQCL